MMRFIDLTGQIHTMTEDKVCAFYNTVTDTFVTVNGSQSFDDLEEIKGAEDSERLIKLIPDGFFEGKRYLRRKM